MELHKRESCVKFYLEMKHTLFLIIDGQKQGKSITKLHLRQISTNNNSKMTAFNWGNHFRDQISGNKLPHFVYCFSGLRK